jgi:ribulose-phosphate 3-epimerase
MPNESVPNNSAPNDIVPMILPSILSADYARAADDIRDVLTLCRANGVGGTHIHVDVMDGHLVPNFSFGPPVIGKIKRAFPNVFFDTHLMIEEPVRYASAFKKAGADQITFHVEAPEVKNDLAGACDAIRAVGVKVGITLKPRTPIETILPVLDRVDLVLIMSVEPGFGGQTFMHDQLAKVRTIAPLLKPHQRLEIDGGINVETLALAREAGVEWFVIGSSLFDASPRSMFVSRMATAIKAEYK